jgi:hypothetical protein
VTGRALVFSNPQVIAAIRKDFVAYAGDKWYLSRQEDADGKYLRQISPHPEVRQGLYIAAANGTPLAYDHFHPSPERFLKLLATGKEKWNTVNPSEDTPVTASHVDPRYDRNVPRGCLIVDTFSRIPRSQNSAWTPNAATGRDHVWIFAEDLRSLTKADAPSLTPELKMRLCRFHLLDNVRGEPDHWRREEVREHRFDVSVVRATKQERSLRIEGVARMKTGNGLRGYDARIQGDLRIDPATNKVTRLDVLSWGEAWGEGTYTGGAPAGRFPLEVAFTLADPKDPAYAVPPHGSHWMPDYREP